MNPSFTFVPEFEPKEDKTIRWLWTRSHTLRLYLEFNQETERGPDWPVISPPNPGQWTWVSETQLEFLAQSKIKPGEKFTLTFLDQSHAFESPPVKIDCYRRNNLAATSAQIELLSNAAVDWPEQMDKIFLEDEEGVIHKLVFESEKIEDEKVSYRFRCQSELAFSSHYLLCILSSLEFRHPRSVLSEDVLMEVSTGEATCSRSGENPDSVSKPVGVQPKLIFGHGKKFVWPTFTDAVPFFSQGHEAIAVRIVRVTLDDLPKFRKARKEAPKASFGEEPAERYFEAKDPNSLERIELNIRPFLKLNQGCLVLQARPIPKKQKSRSGNELRWSELKRSWTEKNSKNEPDAEWECSCFVIITGHSLSCLSDSKQVQHKVWKHVIGRAKPEREPSCQLTPGGSGHRPQLVTYYVTDRKIYPLGGSLQVAGWVWSQHPEEPYPRKIEELRVFSIEGNIDMTVAVQKNGFFHASIQLATEVKERGNVGIYLSAEETGRCDLHYHLAYPAPLPLTLRLLKQDFRQCEGRVALKFLAGQPDRGSAFQCWVYLDQVTFQPQGWRTFFFGSAPPRRRGRLASGPEHEFRSNLWGVEHRSYLVELEEYQGKTIEMTLRTSAVDVESLDDRNVDRKQVQRQYKAIVHPTDTYLGLRPKKLVLEPYENLEAAAVVVSPEGAPIAYEQAKVRFEGARQAHLFKKRSHFEIQVSPPLPGLNVLKCEVRDKQGAKHQMSLPVYQLGAHNSEEFHLMSDKLGYDSGETATILFVTPYSGRVYLRVGKGVASELHEYDVQTGEHTWEFEIFEHYLPEAQVYVDFLYFDEEGRPQTKILTHSLPVRSPQSQLYLEVKHQLQSSGELSVRVSDCEGYWLEEVGLILHARERRQPQDSKFELKAPKRHLLPRPTHTMSSQHSWGDQLWTEARVFEDTEDALRRSRPRKCITYAWPPIHDHRLYEGDIWVKLQSDLVTDQDGLAETQLELPKRWGSYDISLVAVSPTRASAVWTEVVRVGPITWIFNPPSFLTRGETIELEVTCENISTESIDLVIELRGTGLQVLGEPRVETQLEPEEEIDVVYTVEIGYLPQAEFRCLLTVGQESRELTETAIVIEGGADH